MDQKPKTKINKYLLVHADKNSQSNKRKETNCLQKNAQYFMEIIYPQGSGAGPPVSLRGHPNKFLIKSLQ